MESNVYTKNKIIEILDNRAYYIDAFTLGAFFDKNDIKPKFTDEFGNDFYDSSIIDFIIRKLFKKEENTEPKKDVLEDFRPKFQEQEDIQIEPIQEIQPLDTVEQNLYTEDTNPGIQTIPEPQVTSTQVFQQEYQTEYQPEQKPINQQEKISIAYTETPQIQEQEIIENSQAKEPEEKMEFENFETQSQTVEQSRQDLDRTLNNIDSLPSFSDINEDDADGEMVDLSLLSDKSKQQNSGDFKLDVSEKTLNLIARAMAKKIAKHVGMICAQDAKASTALIELKEEYSKLVQKSAQLEEQNKKLRLLLTESNKNLNSYIPSVFGLYKKINPNKK